jgi:flavin-dependent dehydrogenase
MAFRLSPSDYFVVDGELDCLPNITHEQAIQSSWDALILGAGPAGSSLSIELAKRGKRVLLIEAERFPRNKVCGGCLNHRAVANLTKLGVWKEFLESQAEPLDEFLIYTKMHRSRWPIERMWNLRRSTLDSILVQTAIENGVYYLDRTRALIESGDARCPAVELRMVGDSIDNDGGMESILLSAKAVIVAAGLTRSPLKNAPNWPMKVDEKSRIGIGMSASFDKLEALACDEGSETSNALQEFKTLLTGNLHMLLTSQGYAGVCRSDARTVTIAAACDPGEFRHGRSIESAIGSIFRTCGFPGSELLKFFDRRATPHLTRRSEIVADAGVYLLGDSSGYVEPFTGEGMSWCFEGAEALAGILTSNVGSQEANWTTWVRRHRDRKQSLIRWVAKQARRTTLPDWILSGLDKSSVLRNWLLQKAMR